MMRSSLRRRLTVLLVVGIGALLVVAALGLRALNGAWLRDAHDAALLAKAAALVTLTSNERGAIELAFADERMPEFDRQTEPEYFQLWDGTGAVLERSRSLGAADLPRLAEAVPAPRFRDVTLADGRRGRLVQIDFVPDVDDDSDTEEAAWPLDPIVSTEPLAATIIVARSRESLDAQLRTLDLALAGFAVILLGASTLLVHGALTIGLRPLAAMTRQVGALDATSLDRRVAVDDPPAELRPVVEQLNALLDRLEKAFDRERRLSSNLAHELRTPIAELRNLAAVGQRWPDDTAAVERFFDDVQEIAAQMERIVVHLLALSRFEGGIENAEISCFGLIEVVEAAWRPLEALAARRRQRFEVEIPPHFEVQTDRGKLELMIANLLANAVAYAPAGSTIACSTTASTPDPGPPGRVRLVVANPAPDLDAADVPLLFDRFWRKDQARSGGEHAGLGLTLVRAFADLLDIEVDARLTADHHLQISLALATARATPEQAAPVLG